MTRAHAKSFYFASHVLPRARREAAYAIYAFCRQADDAVDTAPDLAAARARLGDIRARLDRVFADASTDLTDLALADVVRRFGVERTPFDELLEGMEWDLEPVAFETTAQLARYCHLVAGVVGHMLMPVLGASGPEARARAADLGVAMQLTNILRDVGEDLARARIYLPAEELAAFGLSHADVKAKSLGVKWSRFMGAQVARARALYMRSDEGVRLIESFGGRLCTRVMRVVYGDILREIERRRFDVFTGRARTSTARKFVLLVFAALGRIPDSSRTSLRLPPGPIALPTANGVLAP